LNAPTLQTLNILSLLAYLLGSFKYSIFINADKAAAVLSYFLAPLLQLIFSAFLFGIF